MTIGQVTRGTEAQATITGISPNQKLNLVLPQGDIGPKGESGVYSGNTEPSSDYDVWIIPDGTPGTIPTRTSQLTNDSGYITSNDIQDIYSYTETQTNKIYIDSNNDEFPIYRKIIELDFSETIQVTIDGESWYAVEHNISNFNKAFSFWMYINTGRFQAVVTEYLDINNQYILFPYDPSDMGTTEINIEYTKISN